MKNILKIYSLKGEKKLQISFTTEAKDHRNNIKTKKNASLLVANKVHKDHRSSVFLNRSTNSGNMADIAKRLVSK